MFLGLRVCGGPTRGDSGLAGFLVGFYAKGSCRVSLELLLPACAYD